MPVHISPPAVHGAPAPRDPSAPDSSISGIGGELGRLVDSAIGGREVALSQREERAHSMAVTGFTVGAATEAQLLGRTLSSLHQGLGAMSAGESTVQPVLKGAGAAIEQGGPMLVKVAPAISGLSRTIGVAGAAISGLVEFISCENKFEGALRGTGAVVGCLAGTASGAALGGFLGGLTGPAAVALAPAGIISGSFLGASTGIKWGADFGSLLFETMTGYQSTKK